MGIVCLGTGCLQENKMQKNKKQIEQMTTLKMTTKIITKGGNKKDFKMKMLNKMILLSFLVMISFAKV
jgi:hypothetical protein